jgi:hypothetical protein
MPSGARVVSVETWWKYCYAGSIAKADTPDAKGKAFDRAIDTLQAMSLIGVWNDKVWII